MSLMRWSREGSVATLTLTNGENKQNLAFAQAFKVALDEIVADKDAHALVITGEHEKFFSSGIDVPWLMGRMAAKDQDSMRAFMYGMNEVFKGLLLFPMPVIAAINGHAFGNGAMLASACDFRFMRSDRGFFCFPEVDISIPFLPGMIAFVRKALPEYKFNEMKLTGRRVTAPELEAHHIIEKACADWDELRTVVAEFAAGFHKKRGIFGEHKRRLHGHIVRVLDEEDPKYIEPLDLLIRE